MGKGVRTLALIILVVLGIGTLGTSRAFVTYAQHASLEAEPSSIYSDDNLGLSIHYPANWVVKTTLKASSVFIKAAALARFSPSATVLYSPDGLAFVVVATHKGAVSDRLFEQIAMQILTDGAKPKGTVTFQDGDNVITIGDQDYARAGATIVDIHAAAFSATVMSTLATDTTVFFVSGIQLKKPASAQHLSERDALFNSITFS